MGATRILITGATGFIGSHVVARFARLGIEARALVRPTSDVRRLRELDVACVTGSLTEPDTLRQAVAGVHVVVHLAALTHARSAAEYFRTNEAGTRELVRATLDTRPRPRRFVYLSSLAAVGPSVDDGRPVGPDDEPRPLTTYGRSKLAGERVCGEASGQLEIAVLRAPAVYGPGDRELFRFFRLAKLGIVPVPAGPPRLLQLVHVTDLADAIGRATTAPGVDGLFHIAEPRAWAWSDIGRMVGRALGRDARLIRVPGFALNVAAASSEFVNRLAGRGTVFNREKVRELLAPAWLCETETARVQLGFEAAIALPEGLRQTARWYEENRWL